MLLKFLHVTFSTTKKNVSCCVIGALLEYFTSQLDSKGFDFLTITYIILVYDFVTYFVTVGCQESEPSSKIC